MSAITAGNWIAFQNESQIPYGQWSVGIENQYGIHGISSEDGDYTSMWLSGICTEADAKAMAASKELLAVAQRLLDRGYVSKHIGEEHDDHMALVAAIAKATGAQ